MPTKDYFIIRPFKLLIDAFCKSWDQIWKSVFVLTVITVVLATIFYWKEHSLQPEYSNWWKDLVWAFCVYISDPGGIGGSGPVTQTGKIIATILGFINILIVAVPAGIVSSAFTMTLQEDSEAKKKQKNTENILKRFRRVQDRDTKRRYVRPYRTISTLQAFCQLSEQDIIDAVQSSQTMRLCDLATTYPLGTTVPGQLVVETFPINTEYGCFIDRNSDLTIAVTNSKTEPCISWFAWHLAYYGGFNFVSKERGKTNFYRNIAEPDKRPENLKQFIEDIASLTSVTNKAKRQPWVIFMLGTSGEDTPERETQLHFTYGNEKGDNSYDNPDISIKDTKTFDAMFHEMDKVLQDEFDIKCDRHEYYNPVNKCIIHALDGAPNAIVLRVAWSLVIRDNRRIAILSRMAEVLHQYLDPLSVLPPEEEFQKPGPGYGSVTFDRNGKHVTKGEPSNKENKTNSSKASK